MLIISRRSRRLSSRNDAIICVTDGSVPSGKEASQLSLSDSCGVSSWLRGGCEGQRETRPRQARGPFVIPASAGMTGSCLLCRGLLPTPSFTPLFTPLVVREEPLFGYTFWIQVGRSGPPTGSASRLKYNKNRGRAALYGHGMVIAFHSTTARQPARRQRRKKR